MNPPEPAVPSRYPRTPHCSENGIDSSYTNDRSEAIFQIAKWGKHQNFAMFFVVCTGSPEYEISEDLIRLPCVADRVFGKPVIDLNELEDTINKLLANESK